MLNTIRRHLVLYCVALLYLVIGGIAVLVTSAPSVTAAPNGFPSCAWKTEQSSRTLDKVNFAAPDTGAAYWLLRYTVQPGLTLTIHGPFPNARYMSFNTYDNRFRSFTVNGAASAIADYQIEADQGTTNPWLASSQQRGSYTVTVRSNVNVGQTNSLPLAPAGVRDGQSGFLVFRTYLPANGAAGVELPAVTFTTGSVSHTVMPCVNHDVSRLTGLVITPLLKLGIPLPGQSNNIGFTRINSGAISSFPNVDNAYLQDSLAPPIDDRVLVIRGMAPTRPSGQQPTPWPQPHLNVRYFSLCTYPSIFPAPVTRNTLPDGSVDGGCRNDNETAVDAQGYYTYVVGTEAQRSRIEQIPGVTFVPFSVQHAHEQQYVLLRNLLANGNFPQAIQHVPPGSTPAQTQSIMGQYYPHAELCPLTLLAPQGVSRCPTQS